MAYLVQATLWVRRGAEVEFREFESASLRIAREHGGTLLRAVRVAEAPSGAERPFELHLLEFPSAEAFAAFRTDPATQQLSAQRARAIEKTEILVGTEVSYPCYEASHDD